MNKKRNKNLTYIDIAKSTNLGVGTISRYFNGGSISKKSKKKIDDFLKNHDYVPNIGAKLIKGHENCVYLVMCSINEKSNRHIVNSIIDYYKQVNINVFVVISSYECDEYLETLKQTINRKPKTLILFTPKMNDELIAFINDITIDTYIYGDNSTNKSSIILDEAKCMYQLVNEIIKDGYYQKIIYIGKEFDDVNTGFKRYQGYEKAIKQSKLKHKEFFISDNSVEAIEQIEKQIIKCSDDKTIIVCATHTIFRQMFYLKIKEQLKFDLTDIGYLSDADRLKSYAYKIFIDFYHIGYLMYNFSSKHLDDKLIYSDINIINNKQ